MALANAGIEMYDLVSSCSVVQLPNETLVLDPTSAEEKAQTALVTVAFMPSLNEVTQLYQDGEIEYSKMQEVGAWENLTLKAVEMCVDGCAKLHQLMRSTLLKSTAS